MGTQAIWSHRFTATMPYRGKGYAPGTTIRVEAGLHQLGGNPAPYFSVTAEIREPRRRDISACGCLHDDVLRHWPELAPVIALHLSDDNGVPMHAAADAWYWMAGILGGAGERYHGGNRELYGKPDDSREILASHLRISPADVDSLAMECAAADAPDDADMPKDWSKAKALLFAYVAEQRPRWAREAAEAIALLDSLAGAA